MEGNDNENIARFRDALSKLDVCLKALDEGRRLSVEESNEGRRLLKDLLDNTFLPPPSHAGSIRGRKES